MRFRSTIAAVAGLLLMGACATSTGTGAKAVAGRAQPALWELRDSDSTLYLYGTIHVLRPGEGWGGPIAQHALQAADEVWTEIEISPAADSQIGQLALRHGVDPSRKLSSQLDPSSAQRLKAEAEALGLNPASLETLRPWLAALTISNLAVAAAGFDPNSGADRAIDAVAEAERKRLRWLETSEQQIRFFANLSAQVQLQMLKEALEEVDQTPETIGALNDAWRSGDTRRLAKILSQEDAPAELYDVLIRRRNEAWAELLSKEMELAGVDFVAVGAAHLVGPDSLIELMKRRGFRPRRVTSPPALPEKLR